MRSYIGSAVLAASALTQAVMGASLAHPHARFHEKKAVELEERTFIPYMSPADITRLAGLNILTGANANEPNGNVWVGNTGSAPYVGTFKNNATEDIILVIWGTSSWVQKNAPYVTHTLQSGTETQISFAAPAGAVSNAGAWAAVYPDTVISQAGQIYNTWGEYGFTTNMYDSSTYDISRLVSMNGHPMTISNENCEANMNTCAYTCPAGMASCWGCGPGGAEITPGQGCGLLTNCATGSQPGAAPSGDSTAGGCQTKANSGAFTVTFS